MGGGAERGAVQADLWGNFGMLGARADYIWNAYLAATP